MANASKRRVNRLGFPAHGGTIVFTPCSARVMAGSGVATGPPESRVVNSGLMGLVGDWAGVNGWGWDSELAWERSSRDVPGTPSGSSESTYYPPIEVVTSAPASAPPSFTDNPTFLLPPTGSGSSLQCGARKSSVNNWLSLVLILGWAFFTTHSGDLVLTRSRQHQGFSECVSPCFHGLSRIRETPAGLGTGCAPLPSGR